MIAEKNEEKPRIKLENSDYNALSALLDFYSDRAVAHASFLVACIFGLFTVLSLIRGANLILKIVYSLAYVSLWSGGLYSLFNFNSFAIKADKIRIVIEEEKPLIKKRIENKIKKAEKLEKPNEIIRFIRNIILDFKGLEQRMAVMVFLYAIFVGILPSLFTVVFG